VRRVARPLCSAPGAPRLLVYSGRRPWRVLGVKFRKRGLGRVHNGRGAMVEGGVGGGDLRRAAERSAVAAFWCQAAWKEGEAGGMEPSCSPLLQGEVNQ